MQVLIPVLQVAHTLLIVPVKLLNFASLTLSGTSVLFTCMEKWPVSEHEDKHIRSNSSTYCRKIFPDLTEGLGQYKPSNKLVLSTGSIFSSLPRRQNCSVSYWNFLCAAAGLGQAQAMARVGCNAGCSFTQVCKTQVIVQGVHNLSSLSEAFFFPPSCPLDLEEGVTQQGCPAGLTPAGYFFLWLFPHSCPADISFPCCPLNSSLRN